MTALYDLFRQQRETSPLLALDFADRRVTISEFTFYRLEDDKFTEVWDHTDMDAVMRQIGQEGYKRTPPISLFSPSLWFHEPRRHSAFRAIHRVRLYAHHLRAYSRKSSLV